MDKSLFSRMSVVLALVAVVTAVIGGASRAKAKYYGSSLSNHSHGAINTCADLDLTFDDHVAARSEDHLAVPKSASPLDVTAARNGGLEVLGWGGNTYDITVCKAAVAEDLLKDISVSVHGSRVTTDGPMGDNWTVYLIIKAPNDAAMRLQAHNGPITLRATSAKIEAESVNGPISLRDVTGEVVAHTQNGPISLEGSGGRLTLETQNGPISVALAGASWNPGAVSARTRNGPLDLRLPENFTSAVRVEMSGRSPVRCRAVQCKSGQRTWDDENRYIEFGGSEPLIRMSTENGPVSVDSGRGE